MRLHRGLSWEWSWRVGECRDARTECGSGLLRACLVTRLDAGVFCEPCADRQRALVGEAIGRAFGESGPAVAKVAGVRVRRVA